MLNRIVKRGVNVTNACTHNSKVKVTKLFKKRIYRLFYLI